MYTMILTNGWQLTFTLEELSIHEGFVAVRCLFIANTRIEDLRLATPHPAVVL